MTGSWGTHTPWRAGFSKPGWALEEAGPDQLSTLDAFIWPPSRPPPRVAADPRAVTHMRVNDAPTSDLKRPVFALYEIGDPAPAAR